MSFLTDVEAQAKTESERVIKELTQLKFDAQQVIHVLNALKLEVPKELRELSPIEVVPPLPHGQWEVIPPLDQLFDTPKKKRGPTSLQKRAENKYQAIRGSLMEMLKKGPILKDDVLKQFETGEFSSYLVEQAFRRMKKAGEIDYRTVGFQGPTEWFLPSRPITLETLRDEVVKTEGEIPVDELMLKFGFQKPYHLARMLGELVAKGTLVWNAITDKYYYEKPKGTPVKKDSTGYVKNFGGGVKRGSPIRGTGRRAKFSASKEVQQILAKAESHGAQTKKQGNDHIRVELGDKFVTLSSSPGDNNRANREKLKDLGINV